MTACEYTSRYVYIRGIYCVDYTHIVRYVYLRVPFFFCRRSFTGRRGRKLGRDLNTGNVEVGGTLVGRCEGGREDGWLDVKAGG